MKKIFILGCLFLTSACNLPASTPDVKATSTQTPLPAPTTVSAAPSLTPAETTVPTPEPPPLYFIEEFDAPSPYWEFLQAGGASALVPVIENGSLRIDTSSPDTWFVGIHTAHSYSDVFIRAKASLSPSGSVGLICRYTSDGWYEFNAATDGTYSVLLGQWLSLGVVKYIPIINDNNPQWTANTTNEIGLFCEGSFLHLYVNDTLIRRVDVTNYGLTEGNAGMSASSFREVPMSATFEFVTVSDK